MASNVNQQYNVPMQAINGQMIPVDQEKIKQSVDNSYLANRVKASSGDETSPLVYAGTGTAIWYGISQGMDVFNRKCATDYEKCSFGKLGSFGDNVAAKWNNTALGKFFNGIFGKTKTLGKTLTEKSDIAYSLANHSTNPEWHFAKTPGAGVKGFLAMDMLQVYDEYLKPITKNSNTLSWFTGKNVNCQRLQQYGLKQADIDAFARTLKGKTFAEKALLLQKKELQLLGYKSDFIEHVLKTRGVEGLEKIAYAKKVRKLCFKTVDQFEKVKGDILAHTDEVIQALRNSTKDGDIVVPILKKNGGWWRKTVNHLLGREVSFKEYLNKYLAATGKGNNTSLGRALPKALSWFMEGCTNRFAGGKIAVAMQAAIFADMLIHTFKAPKGEKGKTLAERFVNDFTYFMAMPLGIIGMHKVGGLKYAGMTTDQVETYRKALKQFNSDVKAGLLSDKSLYKARAKELKTMLKANVKNPITKILKKVGGFINIGNETKLARRSASKMNLNILRKSGNFFRNLAGVPLRIAVPLAIVSPFLAKFVTKGVHKIFGKPTKSVLDEDKEDKTDKKTAQETTPQEQLAMQEALIKAAKAQQANQPVQIPQSQSNLLNQYTNKQKMSVTSQTYIPQPTATAPAQAQAQSVNTVKAANATLPQQAPQVPSKPSETLPQKGTVTQNPNVKDATLKLDNNKAVTKSETLPNKPAKKRYIPSPECRIAGGSVEDYSQAEAAMKKFDDAEKQVAETLAMRW